MKGLKLLAFTGVVGPGPAEHCSFMLAPILDRQQGGCADVLLEHLPIRSLPLNRIPLPNPGVVQLGDHFLNVGQVRHDGGVAALRDVLQLCLQDILVHLNDVRGREEGRINTVDKGRKLTVGSVVVSRDPQNLTSLISPLLQLQHDCPSRRLPGFSGIFCSQPEGDAPAYGHSQPQVHDSF